MIGFIGDRRVSTRAQARETDCAPGCEVAAMMWDPNRAEHLHVFRSPRIETRDIVTQGGEVGLFNRMAVLPRHRNDAKYYARSEWYRNSLSTFFFAGSELSKIDLSRLSSIGTACRMT